MDPLNPCRTCTSNIMVGLLCFAWLASVPHIGGLFSDYQVTGQHTTTITTASSVNTMGPSLAITVTDQNAGQPLVVMVVVWVFGWSPHQSRLIMRHTANKRCPTPVLISFEPSVPAFRVFDIQPNRPNSLLTPPTLHLQYPLVSTCVSVRVIKPVNEQG